MRLTCVLLATVCACAIGSPAGFSRGDRWTFPLVDPLADGLLVTPVYVNGAGPYLFVFDPDVPTFLIDEKVAIEAHLRTDRGYRERPLAENNTFQFRFQAQLENVQIGDLTIERRHAMLLPHGSFDFYGRDIHGVIGRSALAESLAFGFDRDRGLAFLTTEQAFERPAGAAQLHFERFYELDRMLTKTELNGAVFDLHLELGALLSSLRETSWAKAGVVPGDARNVVSMDVAGSLRVSKKIGVAPRVRAAVTRQNLELVPFEDKRFRADLYDGTLGLNFFEPFKVWANWYEHTFYLTPRDASPTSATVRFARWGNPIATCAHAGCATVKVIDPLEGKTLEPGAHHPGVVLSVTRDPGVPSPLELTIAVTNRPALPKLIANLPAGVDRVMEHLDADFSGAVLEIIDVSPFPLRCPSAAGCVLVHP
jgi:hypothetical protein